jgi:hypothetical protein
MNPEPKEVWPRLFDFAGPEKPESRKRGLTLSGST